MNTKPQKPADEEGLEIINDGQVHVPVARWYDRAPKGSAVPIYRVVVDRKVMTEEHGEVTQEVIILDTIIQKVAEMFTDYWNLGWFTTGKNVVAISKLQLSVTGNAAIAAVEIGGEMRVVALRRLADQGKSLVGPLEMASGKRLN